MSKRKHKKSRRRQKARARERQQVRQEIRRERQAKLRNKLGEQRSRLTSWYLSKSLTVRVLLGLIVIPVIIGLVLLQGVILPALAFVAGATFTFAKLTFVFLKGGAFIVYITYKVFKGLLGVYLSVSRSVTGWKAHKIRQEQAHAGASQSATYPQLNLEGVSPQDVKLTARWKRLDIDFEDQQHPVIFSYLRYFILGQIGMYRSFWFDRMSYLTIWRPDSRKRVKEIFSLIGQTIFTPHTLGPHITTKRIVVPGDAKLIACQVTGENETRVVTYHLELAWQEWSLERRFPFLVPTTKEMNWSFDVALALDSLSEDQVGYTELGRFGQNEAVERKEESK